MILKPQDLLVSLKVLPNGNAKWNQRALAQSLGMSLSQVNGSLERAVKAGLMFRGDSRNDSPNAFPYALDEFIAHGVRAAFPVQKGAPTIGIPSGVIGAQIDHEFMEVREIEVPVWPSPHGKSRGIGIMPLFKSIPEVVERPENRDLYT